MATRPHKQHEAADSAQPTEQELKAALDEIAALVGDKYPISRQVLDIIKRAKN